MLKMSELVAHIISSLETVDDVSSCALVARRWTHPAQSQLFSEVCVSGPSVQLRPPSRLLELFGQSPHLARLVSALLIHSLDEIDPIELERLSNIAYPRLMRLEFQGSTLILSSQTLPFFRRMLSRPTLTSVTMRFQFFEAQEPCLDMWKDCSRNIRHLALVTFIPKFHHPASSKSKRIVLDSVSCLGGLSAWLGDPRCPFDASQLRAIQCKSLGPLPPNLLEAAQNTVEIVSIYAPASAFDSKIDLSPFTQITQLDLAFGTSLQCAIEVIKTISHSARNRIVAIRFFLFALRPEPSIREDLGRWMPEIFELLPKLKILVIGGDAWMPTRMRNLVEQSSPFPPAVEVRWDSSGQCETKRMWYASIRGL
ncbi:hypothetical protein FB45DRAFT_907312 [Roridomyces roridus]|uniref:F-box domain-containing protein n=1 Tax=Roridomyces roridus TaxID=1738132 RepID=A0AAD7C1T3_9AGAR|nr:hypothetical protein FB45DRAFT_907312 [Roridomyces roridus]